MLQFRLSAVKADHPVSLTTSCQQTTEQSAVKSTHHHHFYLMIGVKSNFTNWCAKTYLTYLPFVADLKPPFSANPSHCSLSFSSSELTTGFRRLLLLLLP